MSNIHDIYMKEPFFVILMSNIHEIYERTVVQKKTESVKRLDVALLSGIRGHELTSKC